MDDSETYMNVKFRKTDAWSPSQGGLTCTYSELNFRKDKPHIVNDEDPSIASGPGQLPVTAQTVGLTSIYSVLNLRKDELHIGYDEEPPIVSGAISMTAQKDGLNSTYSLLKLGKDELLIDEDEDAPTASGPAKLQVTAEADGLNSTYSVLKLPNDELITEEYEDPPIAPGPAEMSVIAQTGPHKEQTNENIGNRPDRKICLLCLVTFVLFATVVGLSIHVSQIRQSEITSDRNYYELNSTLQSKISENTHLNFSRRTCLKNLSALNSNLSDLNRMHSDLRHKFTEMETKYRSVNGTKAQICEFLTSRRVQACPQDWIENEGRCYFVSTLEKAYDVAREHCSNFDARLLEINSNQEEKFVSSAVYRYVLYWIGKCADRNVASDLMYELNYGSPTCRKCESQGWSYSSSYSCKRNYRFICEKSAPFYPDIHEEIRGLCRHPVGPTSLK